MLRVWFRRERVYPLPLWRSSVLTILWPERDCTADSWNLLESSLLGIYVKLHHSWTQRLNPGLLHCRQILYCPSHCPDLISIQKGCCFSYSKKKFQLPLLPPTVVTVLPSLYIETTQKGLSVFTVFSLPIILNNYKELDHIEG